MTPEIDQQLAVRAYALLMQKELEAYVRNRRVLLELEIAELIPSENASKIVTLKDGTKITVTRGLIYKANLEALDNLRIDGFSQPIRIKTTREFDHVEYERCRIDNPTAFAEMAKYVEVKPRKVAVSVREPKAK